jgi:hypothetical protein
MVVDSISLALSRRRARAAGDQDRHLGLGGQAGGRAAQQLDQRLYGVLS